MRYTNLQQVMDAFANGALNAHEHCMIIDNDEVFLYDGDERVFDADPDDVMFEALDLLGIPSESA